MFGEYEQRFEKMRGNGKGGEPDTARGNKERKRRAKDGSKIEKKLF
jgi:hypothetical protein